jgi:hypothetical protein
MNCEIGFEIEFWDLKARSDLWLWIRKCPINGRTVLTDSKLWSTHFFSADPSNMRTGFFWRHLFLNARSSVKIERISKGIQNLVRKVRVWNVILQGWNERWFKLIMLSSPNSPGWWHQWLDLGLVFRTIQWTLNSVLKRKFFSDLILWTNFLSVDHNARYSRGEYDRIATLSSGFSESLSKVWPNPTCIQSFNQSQMVFELPSQER